MSIARRFFRWLVAEGILEKNPAARLELPPLPDEPPKAVEEEDLELLLEAAYDDPRNYALVCMLADTAARVGAISGLKLADLDIEEGCAIVREKGRGGRRRVREIYFFERTQKALRRYLEVRPEGQGDTLFLSNLGGRLTPNAITQVLKRLARKAGVKGRSNPHAFRHGWARGALQNGADLGTVCDVLGHSDIEVTHKFYARWANKELQRRHHEFTWMK
jgi:site-specific recombinase XerD